MTKIKGKVVLLPTKQKPTNGVQPVKETWTRDEVIDLLDSMLINKVTRVEVGKYNCEWSDGDQILTSKDVINMFS